MKRSACLIALIVVSALLAPLNVSAAVRKTDSASLKGYVEELKANPGNAELREKIIKFSLGLKQSPALPEAAERSMARGAAFFGKASDVAGYEKAIAEFEAAANFAPWLALAYYNLGIVQEKAGNYVEAIQNLKLYLMAAPDAKNARDVKNKIYALEVDAEDLQAGKAAQVSGDQAGKTMALAGTAPLEIEPEKDLKIIKLPQESKDRKSRAPNFLGSWYFKETIRGEDITIHAFEIAKNGAGDLIVKPPKRAGDSYASVNIFEITDKTLKLQMKWKMRSVVGYWKTETYVLAISEDNASLTGAHNQQSVGGRNIDMDRSLFRQ